VLLGIPLGVLILFFYYATATFVANYPPTNGKILANGTLIGGDFTAFYVGGRLFNAHPESLYDLYFQKQYRDELLGESKTALQGELPFVYPPLVAALSSVYAHLSLEWAFYLWALTGLFLSVASLLLLTQELGLLSLDRIPIILLALFGYVPYYMNTLMGGQVAWIGIMVYALCVICLRRKLYFLAGCILSLGYYKPPLFLIAALYLSIKYGWRFFKGELFGGIVLMLATVLLTGRDGFLDYLKVVSHYTYGQDLMKGLRLKPDSGMGVFALITTLSSSPLFSGIILLGILIALLWLAWKHKQTQYTVEPILEYAFVVTASVGFSLQCIKYDLAILLVPFTLIVKSLEYLTPSLRYILFGLVSGFYLEFIMRKVNLAGKIINGSALLFICLIMALFIAMKNKSYAGVQV